MSLPRPRDAAALAVAALVLGAAVAALDLPPATDWPQHQALAALMVRLGHGEPSASATFALNPATHNAGVHLALAHLARWLSPSLAARLVLGAYPPLLLWSAARLLRRLGLPLWRAWLLVPAVLGFSFGWGLVNFCLGTALAWLLLDAALAQLDRPRPGRALWLAAGSLALGVTHVMALALAGLCAAAAGLERLARRQTTLARVALTGALLLPGAVYDLHIYRLHTIVDPGAYVTPSTWVDEPGPLRKLGLLGALLSGLFTSYTDTIVAWLVVGCLAALAWAARRSPASPRGPGSPSPPDPPSSSVARSSAEGDHGLEADRGPGSPRHRAGEGPGMRAAARPLIAPFALLAALYLATPSVVFNTHLIFQRLPQWMLLAALLALPALPPDAERRGRRAAAALAGVYLLLLPPHLLLHHLDSRGAAVVLAATPPDACLTGVIEQPRTRGVRMATLVHAAALGVVAGAADEAFSFARWMGLPVVYRPGRRPPYPARSWEHDGRCYDPDSELARRCPVVLLRAGGEGESDESVLARVFGGRPVRVLARSGDWWMVDGRGEGRLGRPAGCWAVEERASAPPTPPFRCAQEGKRRERRQPASTPSLTLESFPSLPPLSAAKGGGRGGRGVEDRSW